ncbi:response regulator transcription factor [Lachnoclostridium sp. Marseille-P6806]|uniref:response regulator transcription factor n=1 Tax=Lachnoclostridium sp. Marseille-P6806 TaxID=2364793 RepID=UPI0010324213|nr:response regulator [Lachnoclostridium sp. Marseille-P6806]
MNVLVIDDDMPTVDVIVQAMDWQHFAVDRVFSAYNAEDARKIFASEQVDVAICDIEMPRESGLELLSWVRERGFRTQFIFLTSHERFDFAQTAIRYNASGYVVKPFSKSRMETELYGAIQKLRQEERYREATKYEAWFSDTLEYVEAGFWEDLLHRKLTAERRAVERELRERKLDIPVGGSYCLVLLIYGLSLFSSGENRLLSSEAGEENRAGGTADAEEKLRAALSSFLRSEACEKYGYKGKLAGLAEELQRNALVFSAVLEGQEPQTFADAEGLAACCEALNERIAKQLLAPATIYVGEPCVLWRLPEERKRLLALDADNVSRKGRVLTGAEAQALAAPAGEEPVIDIRQVRSFLVDRKKRELLEYLRQRLEKLAAGRRLTAAALHQLRQDLLQCVYVYLADREIMAAQLFGDPGAAEMEQRAADSVMDMIRWQVFFIGRSMDYVEEVDRTDSVTERARQFMQEHYSENISRTEIAASVFLTPEYAAKLFKKETGISLRQYLTECRIGKAKELLASRDVRISDVAAKVGFDNFSYFSTVFRKEVGCTPNEYHMGVRP